MWQDADGAFIAYQEPTPDDVALAAASIAALSEQTWHLMHPGLEAKDSPELLEEWPVGCYGCFRTKGLKERLVSRPPYSRANGTPCATQRSIIWLLTSARR